MTTTPGSASGSQEPNEPTPDAEAAPQSEPQTDPEVERIKTDVERRRAFLRKQLGKEVAGGAASLIAIASHIPGIGDISGWTKLFRAGLGSVVGGMTGGDYGAALGLKKYAAGIAEKSKDLVSRYETLIDDETKTTERTELAADLREALANQIAIAEVSKNLQLYGSVVDERYEQLDKKGWLKEFGESAQETGNKILSGLRNMIVNGGKAVGKTLLMNVGDAAKKTWTAFGNTMKAGGALLTTKEGWKTLGKAGKVAGTAIFLGSPLIASALSPTAGLVALAAVYGKTSTERARRMLNLYKSYKQAEAEVGQFKIADVESVKNLADQITRLERTLGKDAELTAEDAEHLEQVIAEMNDETKLSTFRENIVEAVKQAKFEGASTGFLATAAVYGLIGAKEAKADEGTAAEKTSEAGTIGAAKTPLSQPDRIPLEPPSATPIDSATGHEVTSPGGGLPTDSANGVTLEGPTSGPDLDSTSGPPLDSSSGPAISSPDRVPLEPPTPEQPESPEIEGNIYKVDVNGDGVSLESSTVVVDGKEIALKEHFEIKEALGRKYIEMPYLDTNGDGVFDVLGDGSGKTEFVRVYIDKPTSHGGFYGLHIKIDADTGKESVKEMVWAGDKDDWMRAEVGKDTWNGIRENLKDSVGEGKHETASWGFIGRKGMIASLEDKSQLLAKLSGEEKLAAVKESIPEVQVTEYDLANKTFTGSWLGEHGFKATFTNTQPLPNLDDYANGMDLPPEIRASFGESPFGFTDGQFEFTGFDVLDVDRPRLAEALVNYKNQLPTELAKAIDQINPKPEAATRSLADSLQAIVGDLTTDKLRSAVQAARDHGFAALETLKYLPGKSVDVNLFSKAAKEFVGSSAPDADKKAIASTLDWVNKNGSNLKDIVLNQFEGKTFFRALWGDGQIEKRVLPGLFKLEVGGAK